MYNVELWGIAFSLTMMICQVLQHVSLYFQKSNKDNRVFLLRKQETNKQNTTPKTSPKCPLAVNADVTYIKELLPSTELLKRNCSLLIKSAKCFP